jgi:serine/threonine-protein kinase RsbW
MSSQNYPKCEFNEKELIWRFRKRLPATVSAISPVVDHIMMEAANLGCSAGKELQIETALREALANAIVHGCQDDPTHKVEVCVGCDDKHGMLIIVKNPGKGFDPSTIPNPTMGENIFSSHGRGIYLINSLMDEVRYTKGGTEIHMRKR